MLGVRSRGSSILEFVLTLPFTILLLFITIDTGKAVFVKTSSQGAAATAAAGGARSGSIGATASGDCENPANLIIESFCKAAPWGSIGAEVTKIQVSMVDANGIKNPNSIYCTQAHPYVRVEATVKLKSMLTPTIAATGFTDIRVALFDSVSVESTAYCEVYRE